MKTTKCIDDGRRRWEERKRKERAKTDVHVPFKAKSYFEILLSVHSWTLEANTMYFATESEGLEVYDL